MSDVRCCPWCGHAITAHDVPVVLGGRQLHQVCADDYETGERIAAHHARTQETTRR